MRECVQRLLGVSLVDPSLLHRSSDAGSLSRVRLQERQHKSCCAWIRSVNEAVFLKIQWFLAFGINSFYQVSISFRSLFWFYSLQLYCFVSRRSQNSKPRLNAHCMPRTKQEMDVSVNIVEYLEAKVPNISLKSWLRPKNRAKRRRFARVREVWKSITAGLKSHNHKSNITCVNISDHRTVYILSSSNNCRVLWIKLKCAWKNCAKWCVTIPHIHPRTDGLMVWGSFGLVSCGLKVL